MIRVRLHGIEKWLSVEEWERRVKDGRIPGDTEVCIEAVTEDTFVEARSLESYRALRDDPTAQWMRKFADAAPPLATAALVGICIRLWWIAQVPEAESPILGSLMSSSGHVFELAEPWRLLTMGLLHTQWLHLIFNMVWLAYVGWNIERTLGWRNLLTIFFASVVTGSTLSMLANPWSSSIGASGGVFGLIAATVVFGMTRGDLLKSSVRSHFGLAILPYGVIMLISGLTSPTTDNYSHVGGMAAGLVLALMLDPEKLQRKRRWNTAVRVAAMLLIVSTMLSLRYYGPHLHPLTTSRKALMATQPNVALAQGLSTPLAFAIPAGWTPKTNRFGHLGFASQINHSSFWSEIVYHSMPVTNDTLIDDRMRVMGNSFERATLVGQYQRFISDGPAVVIEHLLPAELDGEVDVTLIWIGLAMQDYYQVAEIEVRPAQNSGNDILIQRLINHL